MPANVPSGILSPGLPITVCTSKTALPQTGNKTLFNIVGPVRVTNIFGIVTTTIGAIANATKLTFVDTKTSTATDLSLTAEMNAVAAGTLYAPITGFGTAASIAATGGIIVDGPSATAAFTSFLCNTGIIRVNCAGSDTGVGRVQWFCTYWPFTLSNPVDLSPLIAQSSITAAV